MKGITFEDKGAAAFIDEKEPQCRSDTVKLQTLYSGLSNGTERSFLMDLHYGHDQPFPKRIGYQHVSRVIECGEQVKHFQTGDVVFTATFRGHVEFHLARESELIIKLPQGVDLQAAALLGVACVPWHDAMRADVRATDNVLVVGGGLIGQFAVQACRCMGASVTIADRHDDRLKLALACGADNAFNTSDPRSLEQLQALAPFSVVMETSGGDVLDWIIGLPGKGSRCMVGYRSRVVMIGGRRTMNYSYLAAGRNQLALLHTQHFGQEDLRQVLRLMTRGDIKIRPLIRDIVPIDQALSIYDRLARDPGSLLGTVFDWTSGIGASE